MYLPIFTLYSTISCSRNSPTETQGNALQPTACHFSDLFSRCYCYL